jgi:hypothetical protein
MKKGSDYDVEVFYPDGFAEPADAKCKFETTEINPQSILIFLEKARKQLPDDLCRHHIHEGAPELGSRRRIGCSNGGYWPQVYAEHRSHRVHLVLCLTS